MVKNIIILLLLIWSHIISAQNFDINKLDSLGLKQGLWKEYKIIPSKVIINHVYEDSLNGVHIYNKYDLLDDPVIFTSQGYYLNGLKNGIWTEYWLNGNIRSEVNFFNGVALGEFKYYYSSGKIMVEGNISLSEEIFVKSFNNNGEFLKREKVKTITILEFLYLK